MVFEKQNCFMVEWVYYNENLACKNSFEQPIYVSQ